MSIKATLKQSNMLIGMVRDIRAIRASLEDRSTIHALKSYCDSHSVKRLHLGAGTNSLPGWFTTDLFPESRDVFRLDATRPLPIKDNSFDFIFCEHMIEHISWIDALGMLKECNRILRPGGIIRISTPDLAVLLHLYPTPADRLAGHYVDWANRNFIDYGTDPLPRDANKSVFVINNAFRAWGHQFLYDGHTLALALEAAGFREILRCRPQESRHGDLRGIERHGETINCETNAADEYVGVDLNAFETISYEAMASDRGLAVQHERLG